MYGSTINIQLSNIIWNENVLINATKDRKTVVYISNLSMSIENNNGIQIIGYI